MKPLRLLVMVAALVAAVCVSCPAVADEYRATPEEIEESQRYHATEEELREPEQTRAGGPIGWLNFREFFTGQSVNGISRSSILYQFALDTTEISGNATRSNAIIGVLAAAVLASIGIVFAWWGIRKVVSMLLGAAWDGRFGSRLEARTKWWSATGKWR